MASAASILSNFSSVLGPSMNQGEIATRFSALAHQAGSGDRSALEQIHRTLPRDARLSFTSPQGESTYVNTERGWLTYSYRSAAPISRDVSYPSNSNDALDSIVRSLAPGSVEQRRPYTRRPTRQVEIDIIHNYNGFVYSGYYQGTSFEVTRYDRAFSQRVRDFERHTAALNQGIRDQQAATAGENAVIKKVLITAIVGIAVIACLGKMFSLFR